MNGVTIDNSFLSDLPPYLPQGTTVSKITIPGKTGGPDPGLVVYVNLDEPMDLRDYTALAYWLKPNKPIMKKNVARFQFNFYGDEDAQAPLPGSMNIYHTEPGDLAVHDKWRGHRLPSNPGGQYSQLPMRVRSIGAHGKIAICLTQINRTKSRHTKFNRLLFY